MEAEGWRPAGGVGAVGAAGGGAAPGPAPVPALRCVRGGARRVYRQRAGCSLSQLLHLLCCKVLGEWLALERGGGGDLR